MCALASWDNLWRPNGSLTDKQEMHPKCNRSHPVTQQNKIYLFAFWNSGCNLNCVFLWAVRLAIGFEILNVFKYLFNLYFYFTFCPLMIIDWKSVILSPPSHLKIVESWILDSGKVLDLFYSYVNCSQYFVYCVLCALVYFTSLTSLTSYFDIDVQ